MYVRSFPIRPPWLFGWIVSSMPSFPSHVCRIPRRTSSRGGASYSHARCATPSPPFPFLSFPSRLFVCLVVCLVGWLVGWSRWDGVGMYPTHQNAHANHTPTRPTTLLSLLSTFSSLLSTLSPLYSLSSLSLSSLLSLLSSQSLYSPLLSSTLSLSIPLLSLLSLSLSSTLSLPLLSSPLLSLSSLLSPPASPSIPSIHEKRERERERASEVRR